MKRFLFFAASAIALFASCQKTVVNYEGTPQEISFFAVNKAATKAPVVGTDYLISDDMQVTAYLAKVDDATAGLANSTGYYFTDVTFANPDKNLPSPVATTWKGGWYWPLTDATVNFVAVTSIGGGVALGVADKVDYDNTNHKFTVTLDNNTAETVNQTDLMYAINRQTKTAGTAVGAVPMVFKHALSWIKFAFKTNVADVVTIKSVELYADYNGVVDVLTTNFTDATNTLNVESAWTSVDAPLTLKVPNAANNDEAGDMVLKVYDPAKYDAYGNGLLVVPTQDALLSDTEPYFVITYTILQNGNPVQYKYKYMITTDFLEATMYTYNINITLDEIEVAPTVEPWDEETATEVPLG